MSEKRAQFKSGILHEVTVKHQHATFHYSTVTIYGTEPLYKEPKEKIAEVLAYLIAEFPLIQKIELEKNKPIRLTKIDKVVKHAESFSEDSFDIDQMESTLWCSGIFD